MQGALIKRNYRNYIIADKHFYRRVLAIVLPIIIQNTITNVVSLLDNVMVGRVGTLEMSAVAIVNQLLFVFMLCIFGGMSGIGIFSTQYAGANDDEGIRQCFRLKMIVAVVMFIGAALIFTLLPEKLISLYIADGTSAGTAAITLSHGVNYLRIMVIGLLPFAITQSYAGTLRELGETKLPMLSSIAAILINLVFNYFLIFGTFGFPKLGVAGAAIATVMSRYVEMIILIVATHLKKNKYTFIRGAYKSLYASKTLCLDALKRGAPLFVNEFLWSAGMATLLQCYSVRGIDVVAASNISNTISNLFNVVFISMGNAVAIMVGQYLGANRIKEAKTTVWRLLFLSSAVCIVIGAVLALCAPLIPHIYNVEPHVKEIATSMLYIVALLMPVFSFAHNCYFTLRSGGKTGMTFIFDTGVTWGVCVPLALILANFTSLGIITVFFLVQAVEILKCIIGFFFIKKGVWINNIIGREKDD